MNHKISSLSGALLALASAGLAVSLFVPLWQIELDAPQYPEGLKLEIWPGRIAGDVEIINGLNHYIGMKTLHTDDFFEFRVLPYIIGAFAVLFLLVAITRSARGLRIALGSFVLFGIIAMTDFWLWEYDYGHNLDPDAAIKVPGMSYQPPLIGFKQLLNFGAFSVPAAGGWLFVTAGMLLVIALLKETGTLARLFPSRAKAILLLASLCPAAALLSCGPDKPGPIRLGSDHCEFCRMAISDGKFGAGITTAKGRVYLFDDLSCMMGYAGKAGTGEIKNYYVCNYAADNELVDAGAAWYVTHDNLKTPMGGNTAAFASREAAQEYASRLGTVIADWETIGRNMHHPHENHEHLP